jgi:hypothetical protein
MTDILLYIYICIYCASKKTGNAPSVYLPRRSQLTAPTEETIPADRNRDGIALLLARVRGRVRPEEIPADDDFGLDDCLAAEDDVGCADDLGAPRDFVARVLWGR